MSEPGSWQKSIDAVNAAFPDGSYGKALVSYLFTPDDGGAAVRTLVEEGGVPQDEATALIARHGALLKQAVAEVMAEARRTGLGVMQLMQAQAKRYARAADLSVRKSGWFDDVGALIKERRRPGDRTLGDLMRDGRITEEEVEALATAHGLMFDEDGELVGLDGETNESLGLAPDFEGLE
jgi:hypothetical protein